MSLLKMRIIVLLEKLKKVTAVADELGMKQPTISFHMRKLEEEWGASLFEMKTGKVILTQSGKLLHHYALQIDQIYTEGRGPLPRTKAKWKTFLRDRQRRCSLRYSLSGYLVHSFSRDTDMQFSFTTGTATDLFDSLQAGSIDLVLTGSLPAPPLLQHELITETSLSLYLPEQHPLAQSVVIPSYRLAGSPFIQLNEPSLQIRSSYGRTVNASLYKPIGSRIESSLH